MSTPIVVFEHVSKKFRRGERHDSLRDLIPAAARSLLRRSSPGELRDQEFWAIRDVSFAVERGEAFGIIGPNGAGKSTALKLLTRILRPTLGHCRAVGRVGALIEVAAGFHPDLTGRENIYLQGAIMGMRRADILKRLDDIVDFAGVAAFVDTPVKRYSSGMNARLGFSIAAHLEPDVLIVDEVLSVGDMSFQQRCVDRMREYKRSGVSIVFVSHNLQAIADLCERVLFMAGSTQAIGPATDVIGEYVRANHVVDSAGIEGLTVLGAELTDESGNEAASVAAGSCLALRVSYDAPAPLRDVEFGIGVYRSADGYEVYHGNFTTAELGADARGLTGRFVITFRFRAHLTRGSFFVSAHVFVPGTASYISRLTPAGFFVVRETRSRNGLADLAVSASVSRAKVENEPELVEAEA